MDSNVERKLHTKFHKDERNFSSWNQSPLQNSWLSQALTHMECHKVAFLKNKIKCKAGNTAEGDLFDANILANKISLP